MAIAMAQLGGIGVVHRFLSIEDEAAEVRRVKRYLSRVVTEPHAVPPTLTVADAVAETERLGITGLFVEDPDGRLLGILTARDLRAGAPGDPVTALMTPVERLVTARPGVALEEARLLLLAHRVEKLPLVDEGGRAPGLITLRDLELVERYPQATRDGLGRLCVAAAIGVRDDYLERAEALVAAETDALVLDIAHGHADAAIEAVRELRSAWPDVELVAGNVATAEGFSDLVDAGADAVKVGIGPGFACTTRLVAGVGVPQLTAVLDCAAAARETGRPLVADGGIRRAGDVAKAIGAGADCVMVGSLFAGRAESPGDVVRRRGQLFKVYRGMASRSAAAARASDSADSTALSASMSRSSSAES
jgi:IMP dehydrogenase